MFEEEPLPPDAPAVLQVSRWDALKDPLGVIRGFAEHVPADTGAHLVYAGPAVEAVADDPEGERVLREAISLRDELPPEPRSRVHLATLPMNDTEENAVIVNALQRHARVIVQKSLAEGFGLTVAEAMWKARPVVASRIGGIQDQIVDGDSGLLLDDPRDLAPSGPPSAACCATPNRPSASALTRTSGFARSSRARAACSTTCASSARALSDEFRRSRWSVVGRLDGKRRRKGDSHGTEATCSSRQWLAESDLDRARHFYERRLGPCPATRRNRPCAIRARTGPRILIYLSPDNAGRSPATLAGWFVDDLDETMDELASRGVVFERYDQPGLRTDERGARCRPPSRPLGSRTPTATRWRSPRPRASGP